MFALTKKLPAIHLLKINCLKVMHTHMLIAKLLLMVSIKVPIINVLFTLNNIASFKLTSFGLQVNL